MTAMLAAADEAQMKRAAVALECFVEAVEAWSAAEKAAWEAGRGSHREASATTDGTSIEGDAA